MKRVITTLAIAIVAIVTVQAQESNSASASVKLNVILNPTLSIEIGNKGNDDGELGELEEADAVNLVYKTAEDYANGVSKNISGHLKVTSIGSGFKVYAEATGTGSGNTQNLQRTSAEGAAEMSGELVTVNVGGKGAKLIRDLGSNRQDFGPFGDNSANTSTVGKLIDVEYKASALNESQIKTLVGNDKAARYTTNVLYTITAP